MQFRNQALPRLPLGGDCFGDSDRIGGASADGADSLTLLPQRRAISPLTVLGFCCWHVFVLVSGGLWFCLVFNQ